MKRKWKSHKNCLRNSVTYHHCDNFRICCHILTKACGSVFLRCGVVRNCKNCLHCSKVVRFSYISFRQTYKVLLGISSSRVTISCATHEWTSWFSVHIDSAWRVDIGRELEQITWLYSVFMVVKRILKKKIKDYVLILKIFRNQKTNVLMSDMEFIWKIGKYFFYFSQEQIRSTRVNKEYQSHEWDKPIKTFNNKNVELSVCYIFISF